MLATPQTMKRREPVRYSFEISSHIDMAVPTIKAGGALGAFVLCGSKARESDDPTYITRRNAEELLGARAAECALQLVEADLWRPEGDGWRMVPRPQTWHRSDPFWRMRPVYRREPISATLRAKVYERDGHACLQCGATEDLTLDHIHPWSKGGPDTYENLRVLCRSCNSSKGARV